MSQNADTLSLQADPKGIGGRSGPVLLVAATFLSSRVYAYVAGVRFNAEDWKSFWHFIEAPLLDERMAESLWFLHAQPPLFNAWLGAYRKTFGAGFGAAFALTFLVLGALTAREIYMLARNAGVGEWPAAALTAVLVSSPASLLFENYLFYTYPEALLLLLSTNLAAAASRSPTAPRFLALSTVLCSLALMRAMFHPLWVVVMLAVPIANVGATRLRAAITGALLPVLLLTLMCAKNFALYDTTSLSSWRGMNLARVVLDRTPKALKVRWHREGQLSDLVFVKAFQPLKKYEGVIEIPAKTGVALLDRTHKLNGQPNFHHLAYVEISRRLERDALAVVRNEPSIYLRSIAENLRASFEPSWKYRALANSAPKLHVYSELWKIPFGLVLPGTGERYSGWLLLLPVVLGWTGLRLWRARRQRAASRTTLILCAFNILYVIGVGALLERSENQRFRFDVDPMIGTLALLSAISVWRRVRMAR